MTSKTTHNNQPTMYSQIKCSNEHETALQWLMSSSIDDVVITIDDALQKEWKNFCNLLKRIARRRVHNFVCFQLFVHVFLCEQYRIDTHSLIKEYFLYGTVHFLMAMARPHFRQFDFEFGSITHASQNHIFNHQNGRNAKKHAHSGTHSLRPQLNVPKSNHMCQTHREPVSGGDDETSRATTTKNSGI